MSLKIDKTVVYRSFPTSNHNDGSVFLGDFLVVYRSFPTSNHNRQKVD